MGELVDELAASEFLLRKPCLIVGGVPAGVSLNTMVSSSLPSFGRETRCVNAVNNLRAVLAHHADHIDRRVRIGQLE